MSQVYQKENECYYYAICIKTKGTKMTDIPIHILLVDKKDNEYGKYLRDLTGKFEYLWNVLCICMDYANKKQRVKHKTKKEKYFQNGKQVFTL